MTNEHREMPFHWLRQKWRKAKYRNPISGILFTATRSEYRCEDCRFTYPRDRVGVRFRSEFFHDVYEDNERSLVREFIRSTDRVLELGGGLGVLGCITNRRLSRSSVHVVVEANPYLIPYLYQNRERNGATFRIEHCAIGVGHEVPLYLGADISRSSAQEHSGKALNVVARSFHDLEAVHGPFDVVISDVQGGEIHVFEAQERVPQTLRLVIAEWHPRIVGEAAIEHCRNVLSSAGFQLQRTSGDVEAWLRESPIEGAAPASR
jgi:FkbM family methyltransferase